jgi:hypothetical protein
MARSSSYASIRTRACCYEPPASSPEPAYRPMAARRVPHEFRAGRFPILTDLGRVHLPLLSPPLAGCEREYGSLGARTEWQHSPSGGLKKLLAKLRGGLRASASIRAGSAHQRFKGSIAFQPYGRVMLSDLSFDNYLRAGGWRGYAQKAAKDAYVPSRDARRPVRTPSAPKPLEFPSCPSARVTLIRGST